MDRAHGKEPAPQGPTTECVCLCVCLESHSSSNDFCHCLLYEAGNHLKALRVSEGVADSATGHSGCS